MRSIATAPPQVRPRAARIGRLNAAVADAMHALLTELAEFDADEVWRDDGATDMVSWLTWELGLLPRTARGWLEVAHAVGDLPELRHRLASGELSLDQVRVLVTIATPATEAELADEAVHMTATEVARMVRTRRQVPKEQLEEDEVRRSVTWSWTQDDRFLHLHGTLRAGPSAATRPERCSGSAPTGGPSHPPAPSPPATPPSTTTTPPSTAPTTNASTRRGESRRETGERAVTTAAA